MNNIIARPVKDLRNKYTEIEKLINEHDQVLITKNGKSVAMILNIDDYNNISEYINTNKIINKLSTDEEYKKFFKETKNKMQNPMVVKK